MAPLAASRPEQQRASPGRRTSRAGLTARLVARGRLAVRQRGNGGDPEGCCRGRNAARTVAKKSCYPRHFGAQAHERRHRLTWGDREDIAYRPDAARVVDELDEVRSALDVLKREMPRLVRN